MLDHASLGVSDVERSLRFYDAALRPLGLVRIVDFGEGRGSDYGAAPGSTGVEFTITRESGTAQPSAGAHLCFRAPAPRCAPFTRRPLPPAAAMMVRQGCARNIMPIITAPSCSIPTATA